MSATAPPPPAWRTWLLATRPRTLAAGVVPALVGSALPGPGIALRWDVAAGCLLGALLIQIAVNFANDAFDALKGADTPDRVGPQRAVASGLISPLCTSCSRAREHPDCQRSCRSLKRSISGP